MRLDQLKVMSAIESYRTAALSGHVVRCEDCAFNLKAGTRAKMAALPAGRGYTITALVAELVKRGERRVTARLPSPRPITTPNSSVMA
jgi:hypothetical protein